MVIQELSATQLRAMVITERVNSSISLVAIIFIILTFLFSSSFNKPINRLIFFASWGNIGSNVASLISAAGPLSANSRLTDLCQFQAFLVQMFLGVDCYWAFCMAVNVYLAFFKGYNTERLRALDNKYLIGCYGLSFVPAVVFLFISTPDRGHIYGPAVIWCWISPRWDAMRIIFLYGIVWLALLFATVVYIYAARVIYKNRHHLSGFLNPLNETPFTNIITTEIEITYEDRFIVKDGSSSKPYVCDMNADTDPYSVTVKVGPEAQSSTPNRKNSLPVPLKPLYLRSLTRAAAESEPNTEAWLYARVAFLFFIALLITWVPSSINRIYGLANPRSVNFPLNYISSFVFPLQGFWNAVVYVITSRTACKELLNGVVLKGRRREMKGGERMGTVESDEEGILETRRRGTGLNGDWRVLPA